ncbi:MAG: PilZ domain-containing protein [Legionellaceae bacterium]|nr:PilZ domain-containing protein [Legionellaceae bacterium]
MSETNQTIACAFLSESALYQAYMPFLTRGGLFIRMTHSLDMGQTVQLSVQLLTEPERYLIQATVVWLSPKGAQANKPCGVGFHFSDDNSRHFCNKIESFLAGVLKSTQPTDTM